MNKAILILALAFGMLVNAQVEAISELTDLISAGDLNAGPAENNYIQLFTGHPYDEVSYKDDCGHWEPKPDKIGEWASVDTLGRVKTTHRAWVDDEWKANFSNVTLAVHCECGCGWSDTWTQKRVCQLTGIVQKRTKVREYEYIPKPKTEYQKAIEKFKNE